MVLLTTCSAQITSVALLGDIALETSEQQTLEFAFAAKDGTAQEAIDEAAQNLTLAWESVAKVDETGCVTAVAFREAGIIVISGKELAANCRVAAAVLLTGAEAPPGITLSSEGGKLYVSHFCECASLRLFRRCGRCRRR